ncbi:MAG TPA: hypothetical protein VEB23_00905 [Ramlibacter sp.]|nr:hypothetical protein [Ramlibacter sp.]
MKKTAKSTLSFAAAALLAVGAATAQVATTSSSADPSFPGAAMIDSSGSYQSEVKACNSGATQQDRATCLEEARNSAAEKRRGRLETYGNHEANAVARCDIHQVGEDRAACRARVMGMGDVEGSVAGGGLLREVETVVLPEGQASVTVQPQTDAGPVVLVPDTRIQGNR